MEQIQYTTVDRIISKLHRDLKGVHLDESDIVEWIGEALDFLKVKQTQEQIVSFIEVLNFEADVPKGLQLILQVARHNNYSSKKENCSTPIEIIEEVIEESVENPCLPEPCDCNGNPLFTYEYRPCFDMQWQYIPWTTSSYHKNNFTPIRLSNHTFFNSIVCREKDQTPYSPNCRDEYTIVGTTEKKLRFSFKEGYIALAYLKNALDKETGYPLIPDNIIYTTAITYYIKWKVAEGQSWNGREGMERQAIKAEQRWLKYIIQAKNDSKMPKTIDDYQDLLEISHQLIPNLKRYNNFFGNLGTPENRKYNDPDNRNNYKKTL